VGRAFLLSRSAGIGFLRVASSIVVERIFDLSLVVGTLLISLPFVVIPADWGSAAQSAALGIGGTLLGMLVFLHLLARHKARTFGWYARLQMRFAPLRRVPPARLETLFEGLSALADLRRFLTVLFLLALTWLLIIHHYYLVLLAFEPAGKFLWAAFGIGVVGLGVAIPSAPGSLGIVQGIIVTAFPLAFGIDYDAALAYSITVHSFYLATTSILGLVGLVRDGQSLGAVYQQVRARLRRRNGDTPMQA
jgi:hypothetical protein